MKYVSHHTNDNDGYRKKMDAEKHIKFKDEDYVWVVLQGWTTNHSDDPIPIHYYYNTNIGVNNGDGTSKGLYPQNTNKTVEINCNPKWSNKN